MTKNNFIQIYGQTQHSPLNIQYRFALLLHCLFHADGVGHQLQVAQNLGLFSLDVAFDGRVGQ